MDNIVRATLAALNQRPIAYQPVYAAIAGSVTGGVLLSQVVYWHYAMGGEFFKTDKEFCEDIYCGLYELRAAKKKLTQAKLVKITRKGVPAKTYYLLDEERLVSLITSLWKNPQLDCGKTQHKSEEKPNTITETTTQTTSETTNTCNADASPVIKPYVVKPSINDLMAEFMLVNPSYKRLYPNKTQRAALERLVDQMGGNAVQAIIRFLPNTNGKKYAPTITTPLQLESKLGMLKAYCEKLKDTTPNKPAKTIIGL